jgi:hypothetical protein
MIGCGRPQKGTLKGGPDMCGEFANVYNLFFEPGEVVEMRVIGLRGKNNAWEGWAGGDQGVLGYFDNVSDFTRAARSIDRLDHAGIFFVLNPPDPAVLSRAKNKLVAGNKQRPGTSNPNIRCIRWLYIDIDAQPLSGISSTDEELIKAHSLAKDIVSWLTKKFKFPIPLGAMSGNGYHLHYRLADLPNVEEISGRNGLIASCLATLAKKFNDRNPVHIDESVYNAARLCKLYGTMARKGDNTEERPHRQSVLFNSVPKLLKDVPIVTKEQLEKLAGLSPDKKLSACSLPAVQTKKIVKKRGNTRRMTEYKELGRLKVEDYLAHYNVEIHNKKTSGGATYYNLKHCLFDSSHTGTPS